jgi:preprotein translocase subunit SecD
MKYTVLCLLLAIASSAAVTGCSATARSTAPAPQPITFQVRLVLDAPSSDCTEISIIHKSENPPRNEIVYVQNVVLLDERALKSAKVAKDNLGNPQIALTFTGEGRERFAELTRQNIGRRLAIVIDGQLYSAPTVLMEITSGKASISGIFTEKEAAELVARINSSLKR